MKEMGATDSAKKTSENLGMKAEHSSTDFKEAAVIDMS